MQHFKSFVTSKWAGGTTTELFIWPDSSSYAARDFDFRLSTATVEVASSEFTPLAGVSRTLMVLEGEMELIHDGHHKVLLRSFDSDQFNGGWRTSSKGTCVDFNLMCRGETDGKLEHLSLAEGDEKQIEFKAAMNLMYMVNGTVNCMGVEVQAGELLLFDDEEGGALNGQSDIDLIWVSVGGVQ